MQLMHWFADIRDKTLNEKENEFHEIDKDKLIKFGMKGNDTVFTHYVETGQFQINQNNLTFLLNDKLIGKSRDIINFKEKIEVNNLLSGDVKRKDIIGYYTGFKENNDDFSYIELLFWVDMMKKELKLRLRLTPREILTTNFIVNINGQLNEKILTFDEIGKRKEFVFGI